MVQRDGQSDNYHQRGHTVKDMADAVMRDPSSYQRDRYTVVVNSLEDDESDGDAAEEEPRFLFNLPAGSIDTTFAGVNGIPDSLLHKLQDPQEGQLVLYKGPAEEVINRTLEAAKQDQDKDDVFEPRSRNNASANTEDDVMELD